MSPVERLIHGLHPWVAFGVMPIFALANAGRRAGRCLIAGDGLWLFVGIVAGLAIGKPLGIAVARRSARADSVSRRVRTSMTERGVLLVGLVGGIGFTMSLFIAQLAFPPGPLLDTAKLAILVGSGRDPRRSRVRPHHRSQRCAMIAVRSPARDLRHRRDR